jgi:hypothetical protein
MFINMKLLLAFERRVNHFKCFVIRPKKVNPIVHGEISGSHGGEYEDDCLLGCCTLQSGRSLPTFQKYLLLHHQGEELVRDM